MNYGVSSNYSNYDVGSMVKSMGLNSATQYFGSQYSNVIQMYLCGQISDDELMEALGTQIVGSLIENAASSIFSNVTSAISNAYNNAGKAEKDVSEHSEAIDKAEERAAEIAKISDEELRNAVSEIDNQTSNIQEIIKQAEEMINTNLEEERLEIESLQDEINERVRTLNSPKFTANATVEDKENIVKEIESLGTQIVVKSASINQYITEQIEASQADVLTCSKLITDQIDKSIGIISQNLQNVQGVTVQTTSEGNTNIALDNASGTQEAAEAAALEAKMAGETVGSVFSFGLSGVAAASDAGRIVDLQSASSTHFAGAASNLTKLGSALGSMEGIGAELSYDITMVGQAGTTAAGLIGSFETSIATTITSLGSISTGIDEAKTTLDTAINDYLAENDIETDDANISNNKSETEAEKTVSFLSLNSNDDGSEELKVDEELFKKVDIKAPSFGLS